MVCPWRILKKESTTYGGVKTTTEYYADCMLFECPFYVEEENGSACKRTVIEREKQ